MNNALSRHIVISGLRTFITGLKSAVTDLAIVIDAMIDLLKQGGDAVELT